MSVTSAMPNRIATAPYHPAMPTPSRFIKQTLERLRSHDPEHDALRRAARAAITVPVAASVSLVVAGGTQAPLYTLLGAFWLMVVTDFPGNRQNRAAGYLGLGFNGFVLLTLGTVVSSIPWLAVTLTFVLGVAVTLAGVLGETVSAGQRATLLLYLWPVCTPVGSIGERLLGWLIALVICVPAALFLLPHNTTASCAVMPHRCAARWRTGWTESAPQPM